MAAKRSAKRGKRSAKPAAVTVQIAKRDVDRLMKAASALTDAATAVAAVVKGAKVTGAKRGRRRK